MDSNNDYGENWESLIKDRMRPCETICKIDDASKRNNVEATKRWRKKNKERYEEKKRIWRKNNPEKVKAYQEKNKDNIKRWREEHRERCRELGRKSDAKRRLEGNRKQYEKEYRQRPEVKERRRELDRIRNQTPERKEYERLRSIRRREKSKLAKQQEIINQWETEIKDEKN